MANPWKKFTEKAENAPLQGASSLDWEKMNAKIGAQPTLNTPAKRGGYWLAAGAGTLIVAAVATFLLWPKPDTEILDAENSISNSEYVPRENSISSFSKENIPQKEANISNNQKIVKDSHQEDIENPSVISNSFSANKTANTSSKSNTRNEVTKETENPVSFAVSENSKLRESGGKSIPKETPTPISNENFAGNDGSLNNIPSVQNSDSKNSENTLESQPDISPMENTKPQEPNFTNGENERVSENSNENSDFVFFDETENELENFDTPEPHLPQDAVVENELANEPDEIAFVERDSEEEGDPANLPKKNEDFQDSEESEIPKTDEFLAKANSSAIASEEEIIRPGNGFKLTGLNAGALYSTDFSSNFYGVGFGLDMDVQRGNFLINAGFHFYQYHNKETQTKLIEELKIDSMEVSKTVWNEVKYTDSTWVVLGRDSGKYVFNNVQYFVDSTFLETEFDTTKTKKETQDSRMIRLTYAEMPILVGYRFELGQFALDLQGGVVLRQLVGSLGEGQEVVSKFGADALFQPGIRYYLNDRWSIFGRSGIRYKVVETNLKSQKFHTNFQVGLGFRF